MKRYLYCLLIILLGFLAIKVNASPPLRQNVYMSGEAITTDDVTENEDVIYNYLTEGVDTIKDNTVVNADVASSANIQASKLNLTSISQNITNTGTFTNTGNVTVTGDITVSSDINGTGLLVTTSIQNTGWAQGYTSGEAAVCVDQGGRLFIRDGGCN